MRMLGAVVAVVVALAGGAVQAQDGERLMARAVDACEQGLWRQEGLRTREVGRVRELRSGMGEVVGAEVRLVAQGGQAVLCRYEFRTRRATFEFAAAERDPDRDRRPPALAVSRQACERAVERRGYRIERVRPQLEIVDDRRRVVGRMVPIDARRDGRDWRVNCTYTFRSRDVRLEVLRR
jgi:hypothetical protein